MDDRSRQERRADEREANKAGRANARYEPSQPKAEPVRPAPSRISPFDAAAWGGKLNIYTCEGCRSHIVTRDVDEGVTPFMLPAREYCPRQCGKDDLKSRVMMTSSMYRVADQSMREDYQWYAPASDEQVEQQLREHVDKGGLLIRKAPTE